METSKNEKLQETEKHENKRCKHNDGRLKTTTTTTTSRHDGDKEGDQSRPSLAVLEGEEVYLRAVPPRVHVRRARHKPLTANTSMVSSVRL